MIIIITKYDLLMALRQAATFLVFLLRKFSIASYKK